MFAYNFIFCRILRYNFLYPLLGFLQSLFASHVLVIEHNEEYIPVFEEIAYSQFPFIAVERVCCGIPEEFVGIPLVGAGHVVVVAVHSCPHVVVERLFCIEALPERVASAPGGYVSKMEYPVNGLAVFLYSGDHLHCRFCAVVQRGISMEIGDYARLPILAGCPEVMYAAGI